MMLESGKKYPLMTLVGLISAITAVSFFLRDPIFGAAEPPPSTTAAAVDAPPKKDAAPEGSRAAAAENAALQHTLSWTFGGKPQPGWSIYVPLIRKLIETEAAPETEEFAAALAGWQRRSKLEATGVLDEDTLLQMVAYWQSRRLNSSAYPPPEEILTAPPAEFFDASRAVELRGVRRDAHAAYQEMIAAARADKSLDLKPDSPYLKIISAFRSKEYQQRLREQSPNSGRAGLAVNSPHFTGRALDLYVGGDPVSTRDENRAAQVKTPAYRWLVENAERFGFRPYFYEPWHWEYVK